MFPLTNTIFWLYALRANAKSLVRFGSLLVERILPLCGIFYVRNLMPFMFYGWKCGKPSGLPVSTPVFQPAFLPAMSSHGRRFLQPFKMKGLIMRKSKFTAEIHVIRATPKKIKAVLEESTRSLLESTGFASLLQLTVKLMLGVDGARSTLSLDGNAPNKQALHTTILLARICFDHIRPTLNSISRLGKEAEVLQNKLSNIESILCILSTYHVTLSVTEALALFKLTKKLETEIKSALDLMYEKLREFDPQNNEQRSSATDTQNYRRCAPVVSCLNTSLSTRISALAMPVTALLRPISSYDGSKSFLINLSARFLKQISNQIGTLNSIYDEIDSSEFRQSICMVLDRLIFLEKLITSNITFCENDTSSINLIIRNIESEIYELADKVLEVEVKQKAGGDLALSIVH